MRDDDRTGLDDLIVALAELADRVVANVAAEEEERERLSTELGLMRIENLRLLSLTRAVRRRRRRRRGHSRGREDARR